MGSLIRRRGTRVPILAIGPFARKNYVSHVVMDHSSIVTFLEWRFTIGSLLDPATTGIPVPEN